MSTLYEKINEISARLTGFKVEGVGDGSFALINQKSRANAWFSYNTQIRNLLNDQNIDLVIDVGANEGQFAQYIGSFYTGKIVSFEPVTSVFEKLSAMASACPQWDVFQLALGSSDSSRIINISTKTVFSSILKTNEYCAQRFGIESVGSEQEHINIRRLDTMLDEIDPDVRYKNIFLKMDTQGYDIEVFDGLGHRAENVAALQSEISLIPIYEDMPHWTESISTFERNGFAVAAMFPVNWDTGRVIEYDCLMTRIKC